MRSDGEPKRARWFALPADDGAADTAAAPVRSLAVVGGGQMGCGIAEVAARAGLEVTVLELGQEQLDQARSRLEASLGRALRKGGIGEAEHDAVLSRVGFTSEWGRLDGADAAVEAVVEDAAEKRRVFAQLDRCLPDARFLASNTSSVPIMSMASATARPERVLGLHFFNPVPVMDLVEIVPSLETDAEVFEAASRFVDETLGKTAIRAPDQAGFVVNALLIPYILCAIRMLEAGPVTREEIDLGMVNGCHHPMGPLRLADLIGLDTVVAVAGSLYDEFHDATYSAPPLLRRMVEASKLGRKTGAGFYVYDNASAALAGAA
jgi:3-hydroxybutyryl-CoA dehydrogenase